jgi:hypothetical protein
MDEEPKTSDTASRSLRKSGEGAGIEENSFKRESRAAGVGTSNSPSLW